MSGPLISVVMAVKNAALYLPEALDSVMAQTLSDFEIVMVDGRSSDDTSAIAGRYPAVRFLQQAGTGFAGAWNDGIADAQGKLVALLDSDDRWAPDKLRRQVDALDRDPAADGAIGRVRYFLDPGSAPPPGFRPELLGGDHVAYMPGALLARRSLFEKVGPFDTSWKIASDIDWFARLKDIGCRLAVLPEVVIHKRVHGANLSYAAARTPVIQEEVLSLLRNSIRRRSGARRPAINRPDASKPPTPRNHPVLAPRSEFVGAVRQAVLKGVPYAAGKIGTSEKMWMYYPIALATSLSTRQRLAFEANLKFHALKISGVFPAEPSFLLEFARFYVEQVRQLDCLGLFRDRPALEDAVIRHHRFTNMFVHFVDQEPDRSIPDLPGACYLPSFEGLRLLLVCPFAGLLKDRATAATFEAVWARTGKRWFNPASVDALEFPYGFSPRTWTRFPSILDLHKSIVEEMGRRKFDVALIAAGGLANPLAAAAKRLGKIGLSLGGHLQVLFGVAGKRWRNRPDWNDNYINDAWIDMPEGRRPDGFGTCDQGAYW